MISKDTDLEPARIVELLGMARHPEGGHFVETWRDRPADGSRGTGTAIYFLLQDGEVSHWHRVDATEIWHWYAGSALALAIAPDGEEAAVSRLGPDLRNGQRPQVIVPAGAWQSAHSLGAWTLVGCTVSPAFEFDGFKLAPGSWQPPGWRPPG